MHRVSALLVVVVVAALMAPRVARADDEIVHLLEALAAPTSDGGTAVTAAEAAAFARDVPARVSGDEAILGIVIANRLRFEAPIADEDYAVIQRALRYRVQGLGISLLQAPGLTFARADADSPLTARFDPAGVAFLRVDLVYTWDAWATTRSVSLRPGATWRGELGVAPATGRLRYAMHVFGIDGRDFWMNYGLELGVNAGKAFLDYDVDLAATLVTADAPSVPALAKLLHSFTHPSSGGGSAITSNEVSLLVEQATWDGGPGVQDDDVLDPAIAELDRLVDEGNDFEIDDAIPRGFLDRQRLRYASLPAAQLDRTRYGELRMSFSIPMTAAEVHYSTDGWNVPHVATCARQRGAAGCSLGHIPRGAVFAYAVKLTGTDGKTYWNYADRGLGRPSNFYQKAP
jgi:hypothetical protein